MKNKKFDYSKYKQLQSIVDVLFRNPAYDERRIRRWYSKAFFTPLHEVYELPWDFVYQNYNEATLDDLEYNQVYDLACENYIEEFADQREIEDQAFAESLREEQKQTLAKKKDKKSKKSKKSQSLDKEPKEDKEIEVKPINLSFDD
jgi:hypothetical protein